MLDPAAGVKDNHWRKGGLQRRKAVVRDKKKRALKTSTVVFDQDKTLVPSAIKL